MTSSNGRSPVLDQIGGPDLDVRHLPPDERRPAWLLAHKLRCVCGSLDQTPSGYELNPYRTSWRRLRDVEEETVRYVVRRVERTFPGWRPPPAGDVFEAVERCLTGS